MHAVQITAFGGPEVLTFTDVVDPSPGPGQVLVEVAAAGVNYADTHQSENTYLAPQQLPFVPGAEVVGTALTGEHTGRRVVALTSGGGYAELAVAHESVVFPVPDEVSDAAALALVLQGTTAWHLLRTCCRMTLGESVVVQAAAGGVGTLAVQLARRWGAGRVIAIASTGAKRDLATSLGAHVGVDLSTAGTAAEVRQALVEANNGRDVDIVLEMTGGHVFDGSLAALAPMGRLAVFGLASRTPPSPVDPVRLVATSRAVIGFWLVHAMHLPGGLRPAMEELFSMVRTGQLAPVVGDTYPLAEARRAHEDLRARRTTGKVVLRVR